MKEKIMQYIFILIIAIWVVISVAYSYIDAQSRIEKIEKQVIESNQSQKIFIEDREFYRNELLRLNSKIDKIDNTINKWFNCNIIE